LRAIVLYGPNGAYGYSSDWDSPQLKEDEALIRVAFSGVCGSDIERFARTGSYHHPMILGHEFSGVIETPAHHSKKFQKGDSVAVLPIIPCGICQGCRFKGPFHCREYQFIGSRNHGGFSEYCAVPERNLFPLPAEKFLKAGSLIEPMAVGLHVVRRSGFLPGKSAIVFGAGPIGLITGLWLRVFGARRIVMADLRQMNLDLAAKLGFEAIHGAADLMEKGPFDYAFEAAGSGKALANAIRLLDGQGTLTVVGRDAQDTHIPHGVFEQLMRKELDIKACWGYDMEAEWDFVSSVLMQQTEFLECLITHSVPVEQAVPMIRAMSERQIEYCKVVITFE